MGFRIEITFFGAIKRLLSKLGCCLFAAVSAQHRRFHYLRRCFISVSQFIWRVCLPAHSAEQRTFSRLKIFLFPYFHMWFSLAALSVCGASAVVIVIHIFSSLAAAVCTRNSDSNRKMHFSKGPRTRGSNRTMQFENRGNLAHLGCVPYRWGAHGATTLDIA